MIHAPTTKCLLMLVSVALVIPGSVQAAPCATGDNRCVGVLNRDRARAGDHGGQSRPLPVCRTPGVHVRV